MRERGRDQNPRNFGEVVGDMARPQVDGIVAFKIDQRKQQLERNLGSIFNEHPHALLVVRTL